MRATMLAGLLGISPPLLRGVPLEEHTVYLFTSVVEYAVFCIRIRIDVHHPDGLQFFRSLCRVAHIPQLAQGEEVDGEGIQLAVEVHFDRMMDGTQRAEARHPFPKPVVVRVKYVGAVDMVADSINLAVVCVASDVRPLVNHEDRSPCVGDGSRKGTAE